MAWRALSVPSPSPSSSVGKKEPEHLAAGVGAEGVGERCARASAEPRVSGAVHDPLLEGGPAAGIELHRAGERTAVALAPLGGDAPAHAANEIAVARVHRAVLIAMERD